MTFSMLSGRSRGFSRGAIYRHHAAARGQILELQLPAEGFLFACDRVLLGRIIGTCCSTRLRRHHPYSQLSLVRTYYGCGELFGAESARYPTPGSVADLSAILFKQAPRTRIGSYSLRLLSEYLHGQGTFESNVTSGTIFTVCFPTNAESLMSP